MTISTKLHRGKIALTCNVCFDPAVTELFPIGTSFEKVAAFARRHDWTFRHLFGRHWSHKCPKCTLVAATGANYQRYAHE